jgi:hypothetical protein
MNNKDVEMAEQEKLKKTCVIKLYIYLINKK